MVLKVLRIQAEERGTRVCVCVCVLGGGGGELLVIKQGLKVEWGGGERGVRRGERKSMYILAAALESKWFIHRPFCGSDV